MKPELEQIDIEASSESFRFFVIQTKVLAPFWHYHPELELTLIHKGTGTRFIGDAITPFHDLDLVLTGQYLPHHWVSLQDDFRDKEAYVFQFPKEFFANLKEYRPLIPLLSQAKRGIYFKNPPEELINKIIHFKKLNSIERLSGFLSIINTLFEHKDYDFIASENYLKRMGKGKSQMKFSQINNYILEHLDQKLTVSAMAEKTHMVPQSFCRWFKQNAGHSFINFLQISRIESACQLLVNSELSIQEIAFLSGFDTLSHFNRVFKKIKKVAPTQFRKSIAKSV